jgi:hypothetical protein
LRAFLVRDEQAKRSAILDHEKMSAVQLERRTLLLAPVRVKLFLYCHDFAPFAGRSDVLP